MRLTNQKNKITCYYNEKAPDVNQGLFQFGVILYQPSGMASKQNPF
jgi:hypothetical protein